jgi:hypothetical protein
MHPSAAELALLLVGLLLVTLGLLVAGSLPMMMLGITALSIAGILAVVREGRAART